jgi:hypothetical protein
MEQATISHVYSELTKAPNLSTLVERCVLLTEILVDCNSLAYSGKRAASASSTRIADRSGCHRVLHSRFHQTDSSRRIYRTAVFPRHSR